MSVVDNTTVAIGRFGIFSEECGQRLFYTLQQFFLNNKIIQIICPLHVKHYTTEMYAVEYWFLWIIQDKVPHFFNAIFHL